MNTHAKKSGESAMRVVANVSRLKTCSTLLLLITLCAIGSIHAVPTIISYQGRVVVGSTNFNGTGQFKFALVNGAGIITFWSNDGTSTAGSEPAAAVSLPVTQGLYSVALGDTTLTNMTAIPTSVFSNEDVRLRVWFNDGVNGSQLLAPDQRISAVGYAMISNGVTAGAITSAMIANGAVGSAQLAEKAVQANNIAVGAVGSTQLAANAVQSANIAAGAVGSTQIAAGAVGFTDLAKPPQSGTISGSGMVFDFGQAFFSVTFPQAFTTAPVVTLSLAPTSSNFPLDAAAQVTSASATQFAGQVSAFTSVPLTADSTGLVGQYTSLAMVGSFPAISYYDSTNYELKYVRATDLAGTVWGTPVTADGSTLVGRYPSLAVVNGRPAISYYDELLNSLKYVRASDSIGAAWAGAVFADSGAGDVGQYTSLVVINGNPAISYLDVGNLDLKYVRATDASGTAWGAPVTISSTGSVGYYTSLAVVSGNPAISYYDGTNGDLKYVRATDASGTTWGAPVTIDNPGTVGYYTSLAVVNGNPAISYYNVTFSELKYVRATDASGTAWGSPVIVANVTGLNTSLAVIAGKPAISYYDSSNDDLNYVRATDASGTVWGTPVILDRTGDVGQHTSLKEINGAPAISYYDTTNGNLKFIRQVNPLTSFSVNWIALPP